MPEALHLARLAQSSPERALTLPGGAVRILSLTKAQDGGTDACWFVCLNGTLLLDLPHGDFVTLRAGEAYRTEAGVARRLTPVGQVTVLLTDA
ncbi:hypothetical protein [Deinococcus aquiradiocola]|uniref:Cupin n=1 Tax=Deinococcus aquiradiocola TaxID=393059 RepID=A0A917PJ53_9DEIO|nr:hypothetical protein [Deinococcus aquiradiocola]GGJ81340.1 hypothetical protein GCM10008939_26690 [Deinococcus aquiradiocola]